MRLNEMGKKKEEQVEAVETQEMKEKFQAKLIEILALGIFGVLTASGGMIRILIDSYNESGADPAFWFMVVIGAIVWGTLAFAVWAIARLIRQHKDIFKI